MHEVYFLSALLLFMTSLMAYICRRFIQLQITVAILLLTWIGLALIYAIGYFTQQDAWVNTLVGFVHIVDFNGFIMEGMLCYLLFAGAIHIDVEIFLRKMPEIFCLAFFATFISTFLVSTLLYGVFVLFQYPIAFIYCLLFGALISPTDPVAVLSLMKSLSVNPSVRTKISGESLFNDGIGIVIFHTFLRLVNLPGADVAWLSVVGEFFWVFLGSVSLGLVIMFPLRYVFIRDVSQHDQNLLMMTISIVSGLYMLATWLHLSAPITVVVAGMLVGSVIPKMKIRPRELLLTFWEVIDDYMNVILFFLLGIQVVNLEVDYFVALMMFLAIIVVLFARFVAVTIPLMLLSPWRKITPFVQKLIVWAGLRGGLAIALVFSIPPSKSRDMIMSLTYGVVVFSIMAQGLGLQYWLSNRKALN